MPVDSRTLGTPRNCASSRSSPPTLLLVLLPVRVASNIEPKPLTVSQPVLVFQVFADGDFKSGVFAPLNGVRRVSDVRAEFSTFVCVAPESGFAVGFTFLFEAEERFPCFSIFAFHLLNRGRTENTAVATTILADVPHASIWVSIVLAALVVDFVPESGRSVQQASKQLLVLVGVVGENPVEDTVEIRAFKMYVSEAALIEYFDRRVVFERLVDSVRIHVVSERPAGVTLLLLDRCPGEPDVVGVWECRPHIIRQRRVLRPVGLVNHHEDVVITGEDREVTLLVLVRFGFEQLGSPRLLGLDNKMALDVEAVDTPDTSQAREIRETIHQAR